MKRNALILHRITARKNLATCDYASLKDFVTDPVCETDSFANVSHWPRYLLYCFDFTRAAAYLTAIEDSLTCPRDEIFLYEWQRANARLLLEIPLDRLFELGEADGMSPTFIVTPGRAGSTLLVALLRALGYGVVSEPDSFTSLATGWSHANSPESGDTRRHKLLRACVENIRPLAGPNPFIKLRGICAALTEHIGTSLPHAKFVFVLRRPRSWAISHLRAFDTPVEQMVQRLIQVLVAYDELLKRGARPRVVWYEDLCRTPLQALEAITRTTVTPHDSQKAQEVMAQDAQANTPLARTQLQNVPISLDLLSRFEALWETAKPPWISAHHALQPML